MIHSNIEQLKKDLREKSNYIIRLKRNGRQDLLHKAMERRAAVEEQIADIEDALLEINEE
jgi:hypothetical protein